MSNNRTIVVWAGDSIYACVEIPEMLDNTYFRTYRLPAILKDAVIDFGAEVTINRVKEDSSGDRWEIDVSKCHE